MSPAFVDGYLLLGNLLEGRGRAGEAVEVYRAALRIRRLNPAVRRELESKTQSLRPSTSRPNGAQLESPEHRSGDGVAPAHDRRPNGP